MTPSICRHNSLKWPWADSLQHHWKTQGTQSALCLQLFPCPAQNRGAIYLSSCVHPKERCLGFTLFFHYNEASVGVWECACVPVCLYFCGALCSLLPLYLNPVSWSFPHEPQALFAWYPPSFNVFLLSSQQEHLSTKPLSSLLKPNLLLLQKRDHHRIPMGDVVPCCITLYFSWDLSVCLALLPCCDVCSCLQCTLLGTPMALVTDQHSTPADTVKHRNSPSVSHPASVLGSDSSQSCQWYCKN